MSEGSRLQLQRSSTVEQVVSTLSEAIFSGRLPPGAALREVALATELGVSRGTVREAVRVLTAEGLVRHVINHGASVATVSETDIDDAYAARGVLEFAGICAIQRSKQQSVLAELEVHVRELERAVSTRDTLAALTHDRAFHHTIVSATRNAHLVSAFVRCQDELRLALSLAERFHTKLGRTPDDHRALLEAIQSGSRTAAENALHTHLAAGRAELHRLRELIRAQELPERGRA